mmetsp:Transcript_57579/g.168655  ORF Transcript_57579/g.168655 Transcript_57579/m.168655 type:complete len:261 (+) Transcript_57579:1899-2681(+)
MPAHQRLPLGSTAQPQPEARRVRRVQLLAGIHEGPQRRQRALPAPLLRGAGGERQAPGARLRPGASAAQRVRRGVKLQHPAHAVPGREVAVQEPLGVLAHAVHPVRHAHTPRDGVVDHRGGELPQPEAAQEAAPLCVRGAELRHARAAVEPRGGRKDAPAPLPGLLHHEDYPEVRGAIGLELGEALQILIVLQAPHMLPVVERGEGLLLALGVAERLEGLLNLHEPLPLLQRCMPSGPEALGQVHVGQVHLQRRGITREA